VEPHTPDYNFIQNEHDEQILDQFLVIGLSKGTIIFVKMDNLSHIYARFSIHREAILQINEIKDQEVFLSICEENILQIWGFEDPIKGGIRREVIKKKFNLYREVFQVVLSKSNLLLVCFASGDSELLVWDAQSKELCKLSVEKTDEHEDVITSIDTLVDKGMIVTGDRDGLVKIWNSKK
jgi:WD40 repeat protein